MLLSVTMAEAIEDAWRPETRPDLRPLAGQWSAMPYPCDLFLELLEKATLGGPDRFVDLGAGPGTKVLLAAAAGCDAWGVEIIPELAEAARAYGADVYAMRAEDTDLTGTGIVYLNQLYQDKRDQAALEAHVREAMDTNAVLISANYAAPPPDDWPPIWTDLAKWRGVWVKP